MNKRLVTLVAGLLSVPTLGGIAYGAAHSVPDTPAPQVILPAAAPSDDPVAHDVADDRLAPAPAPAPAASGTVGDDRGTDDPDDPATHDLTDDHGTDDPATHDLGDDHGTDDPATHDVNDDHGGTSGGTSGGSDDGGSRHGGTDDGSGHR